MAEDCDLSHLSGKERMAVKRQIRWRSDESYRLWVKAKAEKSKQREEYKQSQRNYNRLYYQKMKDKLKERRESKKNSSFEDSNPTIDTQEEFVQEQDPVPVFLVEEEEEECIVTEEQLVEEMIFDDEGTTDIRDEYIYVKDDGGVHDVVEIEEQVEHVEEEYEDERPQQYHSYPRPTSPPRRRAKTRKGVDRMTQVDFDEVDEEQIKFRQNDGLRVVHQVDVGTQVSQAELV